MTDPRESQDGTELLVTERKEAEERLAANEGRFHAALGSMREGVQMVGHNFEYLYANRALEVQGGYTWEQLKGHTMSEMYPGIEHTEVYANVTRALRERVPIQMETLFVFPDGKQGWFDLRMQPVPEGVFILSVGIDDRKRAELEISELNALLEQKVAQRTAELEASVRELEAFSYSVSHDLRAPLRAIDGFSQLLEQQVGPQLDNNGKRLLGIIKSNAVRMGELIDDLLEFSRTGRKEVRGTQVNMHAIVEDLVRTQLEQAQQADQVQPTVILGSLPVATCDPQLIRHVWSNLISNAFKYSAKTAQPEIRIGAELGESSAVFFVQDNGAGFDMKYAGKLFGVFQRLHKASEFEGNGVGLAIVNRIVEKHGGRVWAESEVGKGATFRFSLPVSRGFSMPASGGFSMPAPRG